MAEPALQRYADAAREVAGDDSCVSVAAGSPFGVGQYDDPDALADLPSAAVRVSLGCGNPTAVAELHAGETVLDLGSGGGIDVLLSARRVGDTGFAYGVDATPEMVNLARRNAAAAGVTNVEFLHGMIEALPLDDAAVDVVISNCVLVLSSVAPPRSASTSTTRRSGERDSPACRSRSPTRSAEGSPMPSCGPSSPAARWGRFRAPTSEGHEMAEVLLFHHAQGQTSGFVAFADELRRAGHTVHAPDLYDGRTFEALDEGVAHAGEIGFGEVCERGVRAADELPSGIVYAGLSLGVMPAQKLAQTRPGARGALLLHACAPVAEFGSWPAGVPVQVHAMEADPFFVDDGDADAARELVDSVEQAELFVYPGDQHLFADSSLASYDPDATALLTQRVLDFLAR